MDYHTIDNFVNILTHCHNFLHSVKILPSCQNFISLLLQDKDKNEYLLKASETYEPLNVNFVDLYQVRNLFTKPSQFQS